MPFVVKAHVDDLMLTANAGTAKEAFAKAVEWHVAKGFRGVSISDGRKRFTVAEFSWTMASQRLRTRSMPPSCESNRFSGDDALSHLPAVRPTITAKQVAALIRAVIPDCASLQGRIAVSSSHWT